MTDPQDPLPEQSWLWRRIYTYGGTVAALALLAWVVARLPADLLQPVAFGLMGLVALYALVYLIAPSAVDIAKITQAYRRKD